MSSEMIPPNLSGTAVQITIGERLENERKQLEERLKQVNNALDKLNKNPQVKEVIEAISRITHF